MGHTFPHMKRESLTAEIKVRIPMWLKKAIEDTSAREDLALSDIVRRALKAYATNCRPMGA